MLTLDKILLFYILLSNNQLLPAETTSWSTGCPNHDALIQNGHIFLTKIIPCGYMKERLPPHSADKPVVVEFNTMIHDINSINAADMDFRVDMFLHMTWSDLRLNLTFLNATTMLESLTLPAYVLDFIWTPDPYIIKSKESEVTAMSKKYASLTVFTNNSLRYSARIFSVIGCQMEFHQYPMDVQNCSIDFQSFMYNPSEVFFRWRNWDPVEIIGDLRLLQFSLTEPLPVFARHKQGVQDSVPGKHARSLVVILEFKRQIGHHLVQTYVPSFLLVALSWFSFWMGLDAIPGRVTLLVTSLLTLTTLFTGIKAVLPPVAYVKAIDVWMGGCLVFIFAALGEFTVVKVLKEYQKDNKVHPVAFRSIPKSIFVPTKSNSMDKQITNQNNIKVITIHPSNQLYPYDETKFQCDEFGQLYKEKNQPQSNINHRMTPVSLAANNYDHHELMNSNCASHPSTRDRVPFATDDVEGATFGSREDRLAQQRLEKTRGIALRWIDLRTGKEKVLWEELDKISRVVFPLMFMLFMIIYFPILTSRSF